MLLYTALASTTLDIYPPNIEPEIHVFSRQFFWSGAAGCCLSWHAFADLLLRFVGFSRFWLEKSPIRDPAPFFNIANLPPSPFSAMIGY